MNGTARLERFGCFGVLATAWLVTAACGETKSDGGTDSNTHWMEPCDSDADCSELSCVCGECTLPCDDDTACGALAGASCAPSGACDGASQASICVAECVGDADCRRLRDGLACYDGLCREAPLDAGCDEGRCGAGEMSDNPWCGSECPRLEELSQGCLGSHTEQDCVHCGTTYIRVGGDDASTPFYDSSGSMVAIQIIGEGAGACADAWFGLDLSECVPTGDVRVVPCEDQGPGPGPVDCRAWDVQQSLTEIVCPPTPPRYYWDGLRCAPLPGCGCIGEDCGRLASSLDHCDRLMEDCYRARGISRECEIDADCELTYRGCCQPCATGTLDEIAATPADEADLWHTCSNPTTCSPCDTAFDPTGEAVPECVDGQCRVATRCHGLESQACEATADCVAIYASAPGDKGSLYAGCVFVGDEPTDCEGEICASSWDGEQACVTLHSQCVPRGWSELDCEFSACNP